MSQRLADHSSRGVLPTVVRRCVWSRNQVNEEAMAHWGMSHQKQTNKLYSIVGRDNSVGTATRYELDGPGIESQWGRDFPHPSRPALGLIQPPIKWVPVFFPEVKRPGHVIDHPPPSSAESKKVKVKTICGSYSTAALRHIVLLPKWVPSFISRGAAHTKWRDSHLLAKEGTIPGIYLAIRNSRKLLGSFTYRKAGTWDRFFYFPSGGRHVEAFYVRKIRRLRQGLNP